MSGASKMNLLKTIIFFALSACVYLIIFFNIERLNQFYLSKALIPALCLLGTVIAVAFLYGTAISYLLKVLRLDSDH